MTPAASLEPGQQFHIDGVLYTVETWPTTDVDGVTHITAITGGEHLHRVLVIPTGGTVDTTREHTAF